MKFTKLDYCQYLLSSQINYTGSNAMQVRRLKKSAIANFSSQQ
ncbi:hypothetical protein [Nostoc sp. CHAB 5836]|nr:hypothetical protein [Nostoc sp. CHAB 5836]